MKAKLLDQWFDAKFIGDIDKEGHTYYHGRHENGSPITCEEAQGILLWCPCSFHDRIKYPLEGARPHGLLIVFAGRGAPENFGPFSKSNKSHPRWNVSGSSLENITCTPSVSVGDPECWHGYITNGEVDPVQEILKTL